MLTGLLLLGGCSKPTDTVISSDMSSWDETLAPEVKKLSDSDKKKITAYLMRVKMGEVLGGEGVPTGMTIGEAITAQSQWESEQMVNKVKEQNLRKKIELERSKTIELLNKAVTVTFLSKDEILKDFEERRYQDYQQLRIGVQNNTAKQIVGVAGEMKFIDVFDKEVGSVNFRISESIGPQQTFVWVGGRDYNQFIDEHRTIWNLEEGKYTTQFIPEMVVFQDGTKLTVPNY